MPQCRAKSKRSQERCKRDAMVGKEVCLMHGGRSLAGQLNGNYQHGRYSKDLPTHLAARAAEARANPQLLSLADDIAVIEARLAERLQTVSQGESEALWKELRSAQSAFSQASLVNDQAAMGAAWAAMEHLITVGGNQAAAWAEMRKLWETRCKLVQTEVKTLQSLQQMVTVQQMQLHLGAVTNVVIEGAERLLDVASKRKYLQYVLGEFTKLSTLEEKRPVRDVTPPVAEESA